MSGPSPRVRPLPAATLLGVLCAAPLAAISCGGPQESGERIDPADLRASPEEMEAIATDAAEQLGCPRDQLQLREAGPAAFIVSGCGTSVRYDDVCEIDTEHCAWFASELSSPQAQCRVSTELTDVERALAETTGDRVAVEPGPACWREVPMAHERQEAPQAPPTSPVVETPAEPPAADSVWIRGYYYWTKERFVWVGGHWVPPNPGHVYQAGAWSEAGGQWVYEPGGWATVDSTVIVAAAPPREASVAWVRPVPRVWLVREGVRMVMTPRAFLPMTSRGLERRAVYTRAGVGLGVTRFLRRR